MIHITYLYPDDMLILFKSKSFKKKSLFKQIIDKTNYR